jgi:hypothetical protein
MDWAAQLVMKTNLQKLLVPDFPEYFRTFFDKMKFSKNKV